MSTKTIGKGVSADVLIAHVISAFELHAESDLEKCRASAVINMTEAARFSGKADAYTDCAKTLRVHFGISKNPVKPPATSAPVIRPPFSEEPKGPCAVREFLIWLFVGAIGLAVFFLAVDAISGPRCGAGSTCHHESSYSAKGGAK